MTDIFFHTTPLGIIRITLQDNRLTELSVICEGELSGRNYPETAVEETLCHELDAYLAGRLTDFRSPFFLKGTAFQKKVWGALLSIKYGETISYQAVADKIHQKNAVRAVASAIGKNPVAIITSCHRVIGKDGALRGYAWGLDVKRKLLDLEKQNAPKGDGCRKS